MMRLTWITVLTFLIAAPIAAQQPAGQRAGQAVGQPQPGNAQPAGNAQQPDANAARQPFPALTKEENERLQKLLAAWQLRLRRFCYRLKML